MKNQDVIVLGSGCSILDLSPPEIDYINNCEVIIAINKFMAFYQKSKILPTHVYFVDAYDKSTVRFLQYIFDVCRNNKLENLTFILNQKVMGFPLTGQRFCASNLAFYIKNKYLGIEKSIHSRLFNGEKTNSNLLAGRRAN